MSRMLLDTNILVYALDEDSRFHVRASQIIHGDKEELFTTSKNLSEFLSVVTRPLPKAVSVPQALQALDEITSVVTVLFPTPSSFRIFRDLLSRYEPVGLRIHDMEIVSIALDNEISQIVSVNKKDFERIEEVRIRTL
jgi:predicted nucleic acid-binding protein